MVNIFLSRVKCSVFEGCSNAGMGKRILLCHVKTDKEALNDRKRSPQTLFPKLLNHHFKYNCSKGERKKLLFLRL